MTLITLVHQNGDVFVSGGAAANVLRITPAGDVSVFATGMGYADGPDFDSNGNLYVASADGNALVRVAPDGTVTTVATSLNAPVGVVVDHDDNVIVSEFGVNFPNPAGQTILCFAPDGTQTVLASGGGISGPIGVAVDEKNEIFASNWFTGQTLNVATGIPVSTGTASIQLNHVDYSRGDIFIGGNGIIIAFNTETGVSQTFSGSTDFVEVEDGPVESARFAAPTAVAFLPEQDILCIRVYGSRWVYCRGETILRHFVRNAGRTDQDLQSGEYAYSFSSLLQFLPY